MEKQSYSFATAISMVVGIVIGSGIFFKADDILLAVNGNVGLGLLGFILVGVGVLFGALTISYYAINDEEHIGMIGYAKKAVGNKFGFLVGWFSIACYFPALIVVLAMVAGIYLSVLLGIESQLFITITTLVFLVTSFSLNIFSPKSGGKLQVLFTVAKITPLLVMGVVGSLFFTTSQTLATINTATTSGGAPLSALIAIAFAFDGWIVATNISKDLKDSTRDLPRALALGSIAIIVIYMIYFFGVTQILDPQTIMSVGDAHTEMAAVAILGPIGGKLITAFVVISVYGGLNGMTLAYLRLPKLMVDAGLLKGERQANDLTVTKNSIIYCLIGVAFYYVVQNLIDYQLLFANLENSFDISSLPIILNYVFYTVLFLAVNRFTFALKTSSKLYYLAISLVASITALVVLYGALQVNGFVYILFTLLITVIGVPFYNKQAK